MEPPVKNKIDPDDCEPLAWMEYFPEYEVFTNAEINQVAKRLNVVDLQGKRIIPEGAWGLFELKYKYIGGFHNYESPKEIAETSYSIKAVYDGTIDDKENFEIEKCYAIATFNLKYGLKMTSISTNSICLDKLKTMAAARKLQRDALKISWLECSGKAEKFVMANGGGRCVIDPNVIKNVVFADREVEIDKDGKHYTRILASSDEKVRKIAVGNIRIKENY